MVISKKRFLISRLITELICASCFCVNLFVFCLCGALDSYCSGLTMHTLDERKLFIQYGCHFLLMYWQSNCFLFYISCTPQFFRKGNFIIKLNYSYIQIIWHYLKIYPSKYLKMGESKYTNDYQSVDYTLHPYAWVKKKSSTICVNRLDNAATEPCVVAFWRIAHMRSQCEIVKDNLQKRCLFILKSFSSTETNMSLLIHVTLDI